LTENKKKSSSFLDRIDVGNLAVFVHQVCLEGPSITYTKVIYKKTFRHSKTFEPGTPCRARNVDLIEVSDVALANSPSQVLPTDQALSTLTVPNKPIISPFHRTLEDR